MLTHIKYTKTAPFNGSRQRHCWGLWQCSYCGKTVEVPNYKGRQNKSCGCLKGKRGGCKPGIHKHPGYLQACSLFYDIICHLEKPETINDRFECAILAVGCWKSYEPEKNYEEAVV